MKVKVITPYSIEKYTEGKCVFLAGPCTGARDWHTEIINKFIDIESDEELFIFSPRNDVHFKCVEIQTLWEIEHLKLAYENGLVSFYLADNLYQIDNRGYGRTTRFEIAEWLVKYGMSNRKDMLTIGYENNFEGLDYIKFRINYDFNFEMIDNIDEFVKRIYHKLFTYKPLNYVCW